MFWHWIADFFGAAFLVNAVPHFVNGVSGRVFPTPFAKPPGRGKSSPLVNVLWGSLNVAVGYTLLRVLGRFELWRPADAGVAGLGGLTIAILLANAFGSTHADE